jgi:hypothetical protein
MRISKLMIFTAFMLCSAGLQAAKFIPAKLIFANGKELKGLATAPKQANDKTIDFKENENSDKQSFKSEELKKIVLYIDDETVELERVKYYNMNGKKIVADAAWLQVLEKGHVTLYYYGNSGKTVSYGSKTKTELPERWWLCIRPGEEAAKIVSYAFGMNPNAFFRQNAPEYFSNHPTIPGKITNKEYKYDNILAVVREYNQWKGK